LDDRVLDRGRAGEATVEQIALGAAVPRHRFDAQRHAHDGIGQRDGVERLAHQTHPPFLLGAWSRRADDVCSLRTIAEREDERHLARALAAFDERRAHRTGERVDDEQQPLGILESVLHPFHRCTGQRS
jgi:hypothetical protein